MMTFSVWDDYILYADSVSETNFTNLWDFQKQIFEASHACVPCEQTSTSSVWWNFIWRIYLPYRGYRLQVFRQSTKKILGEVRKIWIWVNQNSFVFISCTTFLITQRNRQILRWKLFQCKRLVLGIGSVLFSSYWGVRVSSFATIRDVKWGVIEAIRLLLMLTFAITGVNKSSSV